MNTDQIRLILAVYEEGSISNAAKKLYISQPSLSQKIQAIENSLNIKIFNRHVNPISLTYAGERYLDAAKRVLRIHDNLIKEINEINQETRGKIRIGISSNRAMLILPKLLPAFLKKYPLVDIELFEDEGSVAMSDVALSGQVDLAFVNAYARSEKLRYVLLRREEAVLFCGRETNLARRIPDGKTIHISEAKDESFISVFKGRGIRDIQDRLFDEYKISPKILLETRSVEVARRLAISCNAVTLYPAILLEEMESLGEKSVLYHIAGEQFKRDFSICYHKELYLPKYMEDFILFAQDIFRWKNDPMPF